MVPTREEWYKALSDRHGEKTQKKFSSKTVAVCGLGGLGSNIAVALARAGIGSLILIDFDRVDTANLNRQQYKAAQVGRYKTEALEENLSEISPYIQLVTHNERITRENAADLLGGADIICEALDAAREKAMLVNFVLERMSDKYLVAASGMAGLGSPNDIRTRRVSERFYLCGDGVSDIRSEEAIVAPRVMLCAAHQAQTVLRIITEQF